MESLSISHFLRIQTLDIVVISKLHRILMLLKFRNKCFFFCFKKQDRRSNEPVLSKTSEPDSLKCRYNINDYNSIIGSIKRVLEFLHLYVTEMTLDAAVGTRALQGSLQEFLLKKWETY